MAGTNVTVIPTQTVAAQQYSVVDKTGKTAEEYRAQAWHTRNLFAGTFADITEEKILTDDYYYPNPSDFSWSNTVGRYIWSGAFIGNTSGSYLSAYTTRTFVKFDLSEYTNVYNTRLRVTYNIGSTAKPKYAYDDDIWIWQSANMPFSYPSSEGILPPETPNWVINSEIAQVVWVTEPPEYNDNWVTLPNGSLQFSSTYSTKKIFPVELVPDAYGQIIICLERDPTINNVQPLLSYASGGVYYTQAAVMIDEISLRFDWADGPAYGSSSMGNNFFGTDFSTDFNYSLF